MRKCCRKGRRELWEMCQALTRLRAGSRLATAESGETTRSTRALAALVLASLWLTAAAAGQAPSPTGNFYGSVVDDQGNPLSGVAVALAGPGAAQAVTTNTKGDFHFLNISPGAYSVRLELPGFATVRRDVSITLGKNAVVSITMPAFRAAATVTVSGEAPLLDSRKTETGATYGEKELESIPTTRDPWAILRQVPGVLLTQVNVGGEFTGTQGTFVGKGSHSDQNTYNVDGVAITQSNGQTPAYFDFDSLDNIEIVTGGSDPSLSTPGVTLNLVTKRGMNQILGSARALYGEAAGWDYGAEAGGPLWKDRLWLWGEGSSNSFLPQYGFDNDGQPTQQKPSISHWNAKLNAQLDPANSFVFSYLNSDKQNPGQFSGGGRSQASSITNMFSTSAYRAEDSEVFSSDLFAALNLNYVSTTISQPPMGGSDKQTYLDSNYVWQYTYQSARSKQPQYQAGLSASGFFDTGDLRHELKFGFGYKLFTVDSVTTWPGGGVYGQAPAPAFAVITRDKLVRWKTNYYDTFVGDTIQAGNFTVNVGARFDYQQSKNLSSAVPANPLYPDLLPAVHYPGDSGYPLTWRQVQPRVGATYILGAERKTLLRASYSHFASRINQEVTWVNASGASLLYYYWTDTNGDQQVQSSEIGQFAFAANVDPTNPSAAVPVNQFAKDFRPPTTDEFIVGAEQEILKDLSVALAYTRRSAVNPETLSLIGTSRADFQYVGNASGLAVATPANGGFRLPFNEPYYGLARCPDPCSGFLMSNRPDYVETYNGFELQLIKQLSHGWMLRASFAYNDWRQKVGPAPSGTRTTRRAGTIRPGLSSRFLTSTSTRPGSSTSAAWSSFHWASMVPRICTAVRAFR